LGDLCGTLKLRSSGVFDEIAIQTFPYESIKQANTEDHPQRAAALGWRWPFVMNTRDEIQQAIRDYRMG
jgi:hypothetical protein